MKRYLPFLLWWPELTLDSLRADAFAALTGAIVVLPQGIAFATIAGLPPEYGLYAAMVPAAVAALFGSSRLMMSGPTTPVSIVLLSSLSTLALPGTATYVYYALTLTFMVGLIQLAMGIARLGHMVDFISDSVIVGFSAGAAVLIIVSQVRNFLGVDLPGGASVPEVLLALPTLIARTDWATLEVGIISFAAGWLGKRLLPAVPYMLTAIVAGTLAALVANSLFYGKVALVQVSAGALPPLSVPAFEPLLWRELVPAALAVSLFSLTQTISIARALGTRTGNLVDANQEFIGQGLSNLVGAFFSSYVSSGSFNRSGVNYEAGARTPMASLFAVAILMAILFALSPLLSYLPKTGMAAVLFLVAAGIIDVKGIRRIVRASRSDTVALGVTFLSTVLLSLDFAILLGVMVSTVTFLNRSSRPRILVRVPDPRQPKRRFNTDPTLPECPQMKIIQIDGALFFGAASYIGERLRILFHRNPEQRHLLVLARSVPFIDASGAAVLVEESRRRKAMGGGLYLHQLSEGARRVLRRPGYDREIGVDHFFDQKGDAIAAIFDRLDRNVCLRCERRIFNECRTLPKPERTGSTAAMRPGEARSVASTRGKAPRVWPGPRT